MHVYAFMQLRLSMPKIVSAESMKEIPASRKLPVRQQVDRQQFLDGMTVAASISLPELSQPVV